MDTSKYIFILVFFFVCSVDFAFGQIPNNGEKDLYRLNGKVSNFQIREDATFIYVDLNIDFELRNVSGKNIILWEKSPDFGKEPTYTGKILSKSQTFAEADIIEQHYGGPSNDYSKKWAELRSALNQKLPPTDVTMTLSPGQTWNFTSKVTIVTDKAENQYTPEISFEALKQLSTVWIKVHFEIWSFNIEPAGKDRSTKLTFGKMLRKQWRDAGYLLLQDITSEPIRVDLN